MILFFLKNKNSLIHFFIHLYLTDLSEHGMTAWRAINCLSRFECDAANMECPLSY